MVAIPNFGIFRKAKTIADAPAEPKKNGALRRELKETDDMLIFLLARIDRFNDGNEAPMCPEDRKACAGDCTQCWYGAAVDHARRQP